MTKKLIKPKRKPVSEPVLHYMEVRDYLEAKYRCSLDGYHDKDKNYLNFWHWLIDLSAVNGNGSFIYVPVRYFYTWDDKTKTDVYTPVEGKEWIEKILKHFRDEFCTEDDMDGLKMWVQW